MDMLSLGASYLGMAARFESLGDSDGLALFPSDGDVTLSAARDITGGVVKLCRYRCRVVWRAAATSEASRRYVDGAMDALGRWLTGEPAVLGGVLREPPTLPSPGGRRIVAVSRGGAYADETSPGGVRDRIMPLSVDYETALYV